MNLCRVKQYHFTDMDFYEIGLNDTLDVGIAICLNLRCLHLKWPDVCLLIFILCTLYIYE